MSMSLFDCGGEYVPFTKWECYSSGMYASGFNQKEIDDSIAVLTSDDLECFMMDVLQWKYSCLHHLSKTKTNRRSWLGQATCFLACGARDDSVKKAWFFLTEDQMKYANNCAEKVIGVFESKIKPQLDLFDGDFT